MAKQFSGNVFEKVQDEGRQGEVYAADSPEQGKKKMYLESYGCQMNFSDSEIVASIMAENNYVPTTALDEADVVFINTCSIRDNAEQKVRGRLQVFRQHKKAKPDMTIGVLGCMAERLKSKLLEQEKLVDLVVGPDAYKDLPNLLSQVESGQQAVNVLLSREETYADITPVRLGGNGILAFVTIMRGCDNMCSFCVVPFTRGRERSRDAYSIVEECRDLVNRGYKEITLLGQNVDSYHWKSEQTNEEVNFAALLALVAKLDPQVRIRFSTSHPKDITDEVLETMAAYENICKCLHLPVQSGNSEVLKRMNRTYDREWYLERVASIKRIMPDCAITSDIIAGFCGETEAQHADTLSIMQQVGYTMNFMFKYSERPGTLAARKFEDDIPEEVKSRRLQEIISLQAELSMKSNEKDIGRIFKVLVEGPSRKSDEHFCGRNSQNKMIVFPKASAKAGDYVWVKVHHCTQATLLGELVESAEA
jgi:tRNA-2-methylthio-N6-dimethylallyladenosine synthase